MVNTKYKDRLFCLLFGDELLSQCKALKDYMTLIHMIRRNSRQMKFEEAVNTAVDYCI